MVFLELQDASRGDDEITGGGQEQTQTIVSSHKQPQGITNGVISRKQRHRREALADALTEIAVKLFHRPTPTISVMSNKEKASHRPKV